MLWRRKKVSGEVNDISPILKSWEYDLRQEMMVRRIRGKDHRMKIQMRLDLGILQMEEEGRPDGKRPHGKDSLLEYFETVTTKMKKKYGSNADFSLDRDDLYDERLQKLPGDSIFVQVERNRLATGIIMD